MLLPCVELLNLEKGKTDSTYRGLCLFSIEIPQRRSKTELGGAGDRFGDCTSLPYHVSGH